MLRNVNILDKDTFGCKNANRLGTASNHFLKGWEMNLLVTVPGVDFSALLTAPAQYPITVLFAGSLDGQFRKCGQVCRGKESCRCISLRLESGEGQSPSICLQITPLGVWHRVAQEGTRSRHHCHLRMGPKYTGLGGHGQNPSPRPRAYVAAHRGGGSRSRHKRRAAAAHRGSWLLLGGWKGSSGREISRTGDRKGGVGENPGRGGCWGVW